LENGILKELPAVGSILLRAVPIDHRVDTPGEWLFLTSTTYYRIPVLLFRHPFVQRLEEVRRRLNFLLVGGVLMPEHFQ
jgi:hypothetical protein